MQIWKPADHFNTDKPKYGRLKNNNFLYSVEYRKQQFLPCICICYDLLSYRQQEILLTVEAVCSSKSFFLGFPRVERMLIVFCWSASLPSKHRTDDTAPCAAGNPRCCSCLLGSSQRWPYGFPGGVGVGEMLLMGIGVMSTKA